ncbi:hypothetical protein [Actinokineospora sp. NBRC 105648]|uniref:hypothetical protein n=1 Tax=Actinokineospora sp. NBRC 105648 TaxID=3032206 RepID=UPI0024A37A92|nr:hypothetical protein [Actinokineospora sp. NBRC 105648]GLZ39071.1 hypothetical protein Acsp05_26950 [Actinokineospora sp. NBRC 105648]
MTAPVTEPARKVTCPTCLDIYPWDESEPLEYSIREGKYSPVPQPEHANPAKLADARRRWYVRCPNPSGDAPNHYLPVTYADYPDPLVVALVGRPRSGKTHLVVAMIRELLSGVAIESGLTAHALDYYQHVTFKRDYLDPFEQGTQLPGTANELGNYLAWLVVKCGSTERPLVFFDVAGEDFRDPRDRGRKTRFLLNAGAMLFVEDAPHVLRESAEQHDLETDRSLSNSLGANATNEFVQEALSRLPNGGAQLPCAVAVTKADRLRYLPPADRWLRHDPGGRVSAGQLLAETEDVYALLHSANANDMLALYSHFDRCTMHFVSATGGAVANGHFPAGIRPMRVLAPLLALLTMAGVLPGRDARRVGR